MRPIELEPTMGGEMHTIDAHVRMQAVHEAYTFMPHTYDELHEVTSINSFDPRRGGVAQHLNEVLLHQKRAITNDPAQGVRSKVEEYVSYASQAHQDSFELLALNDRLSGMLNPNLLLIDYVEDELSVEELPATAGVYQLIRHMELDYYRQSGDSTNLGFDILKKHTRLRGEDGEREIVDVFTVAGSLEAGNHVAERLKTLRIADIRNGQHQTAVSRAANNAMDRFAYWEDVLVASKSHLLAKPIAEKAIQSFLRSDGTSK